jgi:hypothetical protein
MEIKVGGEWAPSAASECSTVGEWAPSAASAHTVLDPYDVWLTLTYCWLNFSTCISSAIHKDRNIQVRAASAAMI